MIPADEEEPEPTSGSAFDDLWDKPDAEDDGPDRDWRSPITTAFSGVEDVALQSTRVALGENVEWSLVGRIVELASLESAIADRGERVVQIIGDSGVGKSAIARGLLALLTSLHGYSSLTYWLDESDGMKELMCSPAITGPDPFHQVILLDNTSDRADPEVVEAVCAIRDANPEMAIVLTARTVIPGVGGEVLRVDGLPNDVVAEIARDTLNSTRFRARDPARMFAEIADIAQGNLTTIDIIIEELTQGTPLREVRRYLTPFDLQTLTVRQDKRRKVAVPAVIKVVTDELVSRLAHDPQLLHRLSPRAFEELVAELLEAEGYQVQLTPIGRDGGVDIYAAQQTRLGSFLYVVQCKKYSPHRKVGVDVVQRLVGTVVAAQATAGIVATTSSFTRGARQEQDRLRYRVSLRDYVDIHRWILAAVSRRR